MINSKQNALANALFTLEQLRSDRRMGHSSVMLVAETLTNQVGEISALEKRRQEQDFFLKRAEEFRDFWGKLVCQLLEIEMEDLDFQVIDGVDIERITQKAQTAILAFDAKVKAANKMAASFQQAHQSGIPVNIHLDVVINVETPSHAFDPEFVFFRVDLARGNHNAN